MRNITLSAPSDENPPNGKPDQPLEVMAPSALGALERASVDVAVTTAHAFPRSIEQFRKRALSMATVDKETAESCLYSRPVGKEKDERGVWKQKFAEGASIRMAEIVAASYGNIRVQSYLIEQTDRFVRAEALAWDLEANYACKVQGVDSTVTKEGVPFSERHRVVTAKALMSKVLRDAIFKVVPKAMIKGIYNKCVEVATDKAKPIQQRRELVARWLHTINVSDDRLFAALGINGWSEIGESELEILTGLKTAISDKDVTVEEAFPPVTAKAEAPAGPPPAAPTPAKPPQKPPKKQEPPEPAKEEPKAAPEAVSAPNQPAPEPEPAQPEPAKEAEPEPEPATAQPEAEPVPAGGEPISPFNVVRKLALESNVTDEQVLNYLRKVRLARPDQKRLEDLSEAKMNNLTRGWNNVVAHIQKS